uniref:Cytochrome c, class I n=1 Tax=Solibacter usitatus (strain Ellin6076) TaxID=234267 RepID=Q01VM1_SOLUE
MRTTKNAIGIVLLFSIGAFGQPPTTPLPAPQAGRGGGGRGPAAAYPQRPPADPAMVDRGKALYGVNCAFCHGSDARGGEGGPNLLRAQLVLDDQNGELIAPVVQNGRPDRGMPALNLSKPQVADVAAFIHSFRVGGYDVSRMKPPTILVGNAQAGEAYFKNSCASCHSVTGDLKGIGAKYEDPKTLQNTFLLPGGGRGGRGGGNAPPVTATVTPTSGPKVEGRLLRIDDFLVTLALADGTQRSFRRDGDSPRVDLHDPLAGHRALLPKYSDNDIHNLTAYLVTVK